MGRVTSFVDTKRAVKYDLVIEQGTDLNMPVNLVDEDGVAISMSAYTAKLQVREYIGSDTVLYEMSTENAKIDVATGVLILQFAEADFVGADWSYGVYDLEIEGPSGDRERIMQGLFTIDPEVTQ